MLAFPWISRSTVVVLRVWICLCVFFSSPSLAAVFTPTTTEELSTAFLRAGTNAEDDVIDLDGRIFELSEELVLRSDEGHGLELRDGVLIRPEEAESFRILFLRGVSYVDTESSLIIIDSVEFRNGLHVSTETLAGAGGGGALLSNRDTLIRDSSFINNQALGYTSGGAIRHSHLLELSNVEFHDNSAKTKERFETAVGGAIGSDDGASLFVTQSYFKNNFADEGGAIHADQGVQSLNISQSAFDANKAKSLGGAVWSSVGDGEVRLSNSSFVANEAPDGGAAIYTQSLFVNVSLIHLTLSGNIASEGAGGAIRAMMPRDRSNLILLNSVVTDNIGGNCMSTNGESVLLLQSEYNLFDDESCGQAGITQVQEGRSVFSVTFDSYAGLMPAYPIAKYGQASDAVPRSACLDYDSRHVRRLDNADDADPFCDAGAYEVVEMKYIDADSDGVLNSHDNCVEVSNALQSDIDGDGVGDTCDKLDHRDSDNDTVLNFLDNCMSVANLLQQDSNNNGIGDACDVRPKVEASTLGPVAR